MQSTDKWYNKYTGLPFLHLGDDPNTGIDCWNLCMHIYREHRGIDIKQRTIDFCNIVDDNWYNKTTESLYEDGFKKFSHIFRKVDDAPKVFDVIVMSIGSTLISNHFALYVDTNRILHAMLDHTSWVSPYGSYYQQYTTGVYRWTGLTS